MGIGVTTAKRETSYLMIQCTVYGKEQKQLLFFWSLNPPQQVKAAKGRQNTHAVPAGPRKTDAGSRNRYSHPLGPVHAIPEHQPIGLELRALGIENVAGLAAAVLDADLGALVEGVEARRQRLAQRRHGTARVQRRPRLHAALAAARLQHQQQRVQPRHDLGDREAEELLRVAGCRQLVVP